LVIPFKDLEAKVPGWLLRRFTKAKLLCRKMNVCGIVTTLGQDMKYEEDNLKDKTRTCIPLRNKTQHVKVC